jgi:O-antigen ligase
MSQEPSVYVLYQTWIVLFSYYSKKLFRKTGFVLIGINTLSWILTFSTALLAFFAILTVSFFVLEIPRRIRYFSVLIMGVIVLGGVTFIAKNNEVSAYLNLIYVNKALDFFTFPDHTRSSGAMRIYTVRLGYEIFKEHPVVGVGVGNSVYHMNGHDSKTGIRGARLNPGIFPLNTFCCVLAEQGLIGGIALVGFIWVIFRSSWKHRNRDKLCKVFFIGTLFNISTMLSIAPVYCLYIWVFLSLSFGYYKYIDRRFDM